MSIDATSIFSTSSSSTVATTEDSSTLTMNDFFELLVAELQNQSMLDPVDTSEFIGQMAQFSTLSQMQELNNTIQMAYAISLLGKNVTVYSTNDSGVTTVASGTVDSVTYQNDIPYVKIDGSSYPASDVLTVNNT